MSGAKGVVDVPAVQLTDIDMTYRVPVRASGLGSALASVVHRRYEEVHAVRRASFAIEPGELVGFIGSNGAGKTTTMKILSGLLQPTSGTVDVLGFTPWERRRDFLRRIALVRGNQPVGSFQELTVMDTLAYQRVLYQIPRRTYNQDLARLVDLLDLAPLLRRQLRGLSLGEKMKAGLAQSLLYRPEVLFLDEPTLGLDVNTAAVVREFIGAFVADTGATVLLTSHYMTDVQSLCNRIVLINDGEVQFNGELDRLSTQVAPYKLVTVTAPRAQASDFPRQCRIVDVSDEKWTLEVDRGHVAEVTTDLLRRLDVKDLSVAEPEFTEVVRTALEDGVQAAS